MAKINLPRLDKGTASVGIHRQRIRARLKNATARSLCPMQIPPSLFFYQLLLPKKERERGASGSMGINKPKRRDRARNRTMARRRDRSTSADDFSFLKPPLKRERERERKKAETTTSTTQRCGSSISRRERASARLSRRQGKTLPVDIPSRWWCRD